MRKELSRMPGQMIFFARALSALFVIQQQQAVVSDCQAGTDLHISGGNMC